MKCEIVSGTLAEYKAEIFHIFEVDDTRASHELIL